MAQVRAPTCPKVLLMFLSLMIEREMKRGREMKREMERERERERERMDLV